MPYVHYAAVLRVHIWIQYLTTYLALWFTVCVHKTTLKACSTWLGVGHNNTHSSIQLDLMMKVLFHDNFMW